MSTDGNDPLLIYEKAFETLGLRVFAHYELWITAGITDQPYIDWWYNFLRQELEQAKPHVSQVSREGAKLLRAADQAQYEEGKESLSEIDASLADRERNFCKILLGGIIESYRIARLEGAGSEVTSIKLLLSGSGSISPSCLSVGQIGGERDYLITFYCMLGFFKDPRSSRKWR